MESELRHSDNPRYSKDDAGQWWYQPLGSARDGRPWPRIRAFERTCDECGVRFLWQARTRHNSTRNKGFYCSIQCANKTRYKEQGAPRGDAHRSWQGGRRTTAQGYVQIWSGDHPSRNKNNYIYEHRLVMEQLLGRYLRPGENIHHKNGIRDDNRPENLELWVISQPRGQRIGEQKHCPTCTCAQLTKGP